MDKFDVINLDEELQELFKKEEVFAMLDFQFVVDEKDTFTGFCVILKSKNKESGLRYLSFIFVIDSPDSVKATKIKNALQNLNFNSLKKNIPELKKEISFTNPESTTKHCYYEVYLYFDESIITAERLLSEKIYKEMKFIQGFKIGELVFWQE